MARAQHEGTPRETRSKGYVYPPRARTVLWASLAVGAVLIATLIGGYAVGARRTLSPGDVASHHARIDLKCAQCHDAGKQVEALRCERCHDPSGSERLSQPAHVLLGSGDPRKAEMAEMTQCATCHLEHKGLGASLRAVDDRECATCHAFSTLARHPEFAVTRAGATPGVGLKFNHDLHILEVKRQRGGSCQLCHTPTADKRAFEPIKFEQHCGATCHPFTETDPIQVDSVLPKMTGRTEPLAVAPLLPEPFRSATNAKLAIDGRDVVASQLKHRDGWVMFNALRLRGSMDFDGEASERLTLRARIAYLQQLQAVRPVYEATAQELQEAVTQLQAEIAALDGQLAQTGSSDLDAIRETLTSAQTIAKLLAATNDGAKADAQAIVGTTLDAKAAAPLPDKEAQARFDRRKRELVTLLDTVIARTADEGLKQRATALKADVQKLDGARDDQRRRWGGASGSADESGRRPRHDTGDSRSRCALRDRADRPGALVRAAGRRHGAVRGRFRDAPRRAAHVAHEHRAAWRNERPPSNCAAAAADSGAAARLDRHSRAGAEPPCTAEAARSRAPRAGTAGITGSGSTARAGRRRRSTGDPRDAGDPAAAAE